MFDYNRSEDFVTLKVEVSGRTALTINKSEVTVTTKPIFKESNVNTSALLPLGNEYVLPNTSHILHPILSIVVLPLTPK